MLDGIIVKPLKKIADERGFFSMVMREDMDDILGGDHIVQSNHSLTYPGVVRAWHKHTKGQNDYFLVLGGALKICGFEEKSRELSEVFSTGDSLQLVRMPGKYWHGFKAIGTKPALLVYFVNKLYDQAHPDEDRRPWNDQSIVPLSINGSREDTRCGKPWNWFHPPHK